MAIKNNTKYYLFTGWIVMAAAYLSLVVPRLQRPFFGWEALMWQIPVDIVHKGYAGVGFFYAPPLGESLIAMSFTAFGISEWVARMPGMVCFMAMPVLIYLIMKEIDRENAGPAAIIAGLIYFTSPAVIQGSLTTDRFDSTVLTFMISLFYVALLKTENTRYFRRMAILGAVFCLCLWTKLTTPLACLVAVPAGYILSAQPGKAVKTFLGIFIAGFAFFVMTWGAFCRFIIGWGRFLESVGYYQKSAAVTLSFLRGSLPERVSLDIFRIALWLSPFLLLLATTTLFNIIRRLNKTPPPGSGDSQLAALVIIVSAVYFYGNGTAVGFPKYLVPVLPMVSCLVAKYVCQNLKAETGFRSLAFIAACVCIGVWYYAAACGDMIYQIFAFRQAQLNGTIASTARGFLLKEGLYFLFPALVLLCSQAFMSITLKKRLILAAVIALVSGNIAVDLCQRGADYATNFSYGSRGAQQVKDFLRARQPLDVFTSIEGYMGNCGDVTFRAINADIWDDPEKFMEFVRRVKPQCLIYGLASNTVYQLKKTLGDPAVKGFLTDNYDEQVFGSYAVLMRRPHSS